jgi:hypothetical protein
MSERGAPAAFRGYRLQALYTLWRVLTSGNDTSQVFYLEGREDLDIKNNDGRIIELVQVKSYKNLVLSDLSPENDNSFFRRVLETLKTAEPPNILLVNFGHIGEEMRLAWEGIDEYRGHFFEKLRNLNYSNEDIQIIFKYVTLIELTENHVQNEVYKLLCNQITGIDPINTFELLHFWLYLLSEKQSYITYPDLIRKIQNVGRYLSERYHHQEWFTSIQPIEDYSISEEQYAYLKDEFYRGVSAQYGHILAGLDFYRQKKMEEITQSFLDNKVVIIHAASGQGKSTLANRYLHDRFPNKWRFSIQLVENRQHALRIATALAGHADSVGTPMAIFIDVSPKDDDWVELVGRLSKHPLLQILVAIREEDYKRAIIAESFKYTDVDLTFNIDEAKLIYERAQEANMLADIMSFDDAWHSFRENGPLLEFIYLLTQTETLQQRLEGQITRLRQEVREKKLNPDELHVLRLISVASAFDARLKISDLLKLVNLPEPSLTFKNYEKEYLLRISPDGSLVTGLHPIRSKILCQLLTDQVIYPWIEIAKQVLSIMQEEDWEIFVLQAFIDNDENFQEIINIVTGLKPKSLTGLAGILRCLLWAGIKKYIEDNWELLDTAYKLFGQGWHLFIDINFAGEEAPSIKDWWKEFSYLIPEDKQIGIEQIQQKLLPKDDAFQIALEWLNSIGELFFVPSSNRDWEALPEILYWSSRWGLSEKVKNWVPVETFSLIVNSLSLQNLSELFFAIYLIDKAKYFTLIDANRAIIEEKLAQEYDLFAFEEKDDVLTIHFLTYPKDNEENQSDTKISSNIHSQTIERLQLVRLLFPNFKKYGSQGYGHQISGLGFNQDDSTKTGVDYKHLPPKWPIRINGIAIGLVHYHFRLEHWEDFFQQIINIREMIVDCLNPLIPGIARYFNRAKPQNLGEIETFTQHQWENCMKMINNPPMLPKPAVDPWGIAQPESNPNENKNIQSILPASILVQIYNKYHETEQKFFSNLNNFMGQASHVINTNYYAGKLPENSPQKNAILKYLKDKDIKTELGFLSFYNLTEAREAIFQYQTNFRQLFGHRIDKNILTSLEQRENEVFINIWHFWYFFATKPRTSCSNGIKEIPSRVENIIQNLYRKINTAIKDVRKDYINLKIINDMKWENSQSIYILIDINNATQIYQKIEEVIQCLRNAVDIVDPHELEYRLIDEKLKYVVFIVTIQGKMINSLVWPIRTVFTIIDHKPIEEKLWAYIPQEIPDNLFDKLGLAKWENEDIDNANSFSASVSNLKLLLSMISKLKDMPEKTEAGLAKLKIFMEERSYDLSKLLQLFIDSSTKLLDRFNSLPEEKKPERINLCSAINILNEIYASVLPGKDSQEKEILDLDGVLEYVKKLQEVLGTCEMIKLYWIQDIIENDFNSEINEK